jgi:hypothetical protein
MSQSELLILFQGSAPYYLRIISRYSIGRR